MSGDGFPGQSACLHLFLRWSSPGLLGTTSFSLPIRCPAFLGRASGGIRHTCPSHSIFCSLQFRSEILHLYYGATLLLKLVLLNHKILSNFRKYLFWKVSILCAILVVSFQHSAPYNKTLRTLLLKILRLVLVPNCFDFQMFFRRTSGV